MTIKNLLKYPLDFNTHNPLHYHEDPDTKFIFYAEFGLGQIGDYDYYIRMYISNKFNTEDNYVGYALYNIHITSEMWGNLFLYSTHHAEEILKLKRFKNK